MNRGKDRIDVSDDDSVVIIYEHDDPDATPDDDGWKIVQIRFYREGEALPHLTINEGG